MDRIIWISTEQPAEGDVEATKEYGPIDPQHPFYGALLFLLEKMDTSQELEF